MPASMIFSVTLLAASPAVSCTGTPNLKLSVAAIHGRIVEKETYAVSDVEMMARRSGRALRHRPLGFYIGGFGQSILIDRERRFTPEGDGCSIITTVNVHLYLVDRTIEVANDLVRNGCDPSAVWAHYRKHAEADDVILRRYVEPAVAGVRAAWPDLQRLIGPDQDSDTTALARGVQVVLEQTLKDYDQVREEAFAAVDTPQEVDTLVCGMRG